MTIFRQVTESAYYVGCELYVSWLVFLCIQRQGDGSCAGSGGSEGGAEAAAALHRAAEEGAEPRAPVDPHRRPA